MNSVLSYLFKFTWLNWRIVDRFHRRSCYRHNSLKIVTALLLINSKKSVVRVMEVIEVVVISPPPRLHSCYFQIFFIVSVSICSCAYYYPAVVIR